MAARFRYFYFPHSRRKERDCKRCPPCGSCLPAPPLTPPASGSSGARSSRHKHSSPAPAAAAQPGRSPGQRRQQQPAQREDHPPAGRPRQAGHRRRSLQLEQPRPTPARLPEPGGGICFWFSVDLECFRGKRTFKTKCPQLWSWGNKLVKSLQTCQRQQLSAHRVCVGERLRNRSLWIPLMQDSSTDNRYSCFCCRFTEVSRSNPVEVIAGPTFQATKSRKQ